MKYIEINFQPRVFLPVRVKPFFASLDNLQINRVTQTLAINSNFIILTSGQPDGVNLDYLF